MARIVRESDAVLPRERHEAMREREDARAAELLSLLRRVEDEFEALRTEQRTATARLSLALAEKLALGAFEADPDRIARLVDDAMARLPHAKRAVVLVHPDDASRVSVTPPIAAVVTDDALSRGDCVIEADVGRVDARMRTRVASLRKALGLAEDA